MNRPNTIKSKSKTGQSGYFRWSVLIYPKSKIILARRKPRRTKVMGFGAGKTMPKITIGARLYPSYRNPGYAC
ncbi:MAG: hypothetical protein GY862_31890 [Gammaproteobacteria bacterium]|nr:hypothetical protein [Gammaproteobacteria bacterium]